MNIYIYINIYKDMYIYLYIVSIIIYEKVPPSNLDDFLYCQDHHSESCSHDFNDRCSLKSYKEEISSKKLKLVLSNFYLIFI